MSPTKVLWAALSGAITLCALMAGAWATEATKRADAFDLRMSVTEQHYAAIQADLQDLREHVKELKQIMIHQEVAHGQ